MNDRGMSISSSILDKRDLVADKSFSWKDIKAFIYLAEAYASTSLNYDLFSGTYINVPVYLFLLFTILVGMPYLCMDFFIKQYSGRIDFNQLLNPFLKAINYGVLFVTAFWALIHANDLADSILFFVMTFRPIPVWSECSNSGGNNEEKSCIPTQNITILCQVIKHKININVTSVHFNYKSLFISNQRKVFFTRRLFLIALVWINIFITFNVSETTLVKLLNLTYLFRNISTFVATIFVIGSAGSHVTGALKDILKFNQKLSVTLTASHVFYVFGVGLLGVYDFGSLSPFMMVDNAVIAFAVAFVVMTMLRAIVVRIFYRVVTECLIIKAQFNQKFITSHYLLFVIMPLGADFFYAQRLFTLYLYVYLTITLFGNLSAVIGCISKLLHNEFQIIKEIYITGSLCFFGFFLTIPVAMNIQHISGYIFGLSTCMYLLAGLRVVIIMYIYGVDKFSTDIHFWLGFKPAKYWTVTWILLPVCLGFLILRRALDLHKHALTHKDMLLTGLPLATYILSVVIIIATVIFVTYLVRNNIKGLFRSSNYYGPPDSDDRKMRKKYDETLNLRQCLHNCIALDDKFDCNHMPLIFKSKASGSMSASSITQIFETSHRKSGLLAMTDATTSQDRQD